MLSVIPTILSRVDEGAQIKLRFLLELSQLNFWIIALELSNECYCYLAVLSHFGLHMRILIARVGSHCLQRPNLFRFPSRQLR